MDNPNKYEVDHTTLSLSPETQEILALVADNLGKSMSGTIDMLFSGTDMEVDDVVVNIDMLRGLRR